MNSDLATNSVGSDQGNGGGLTTFELIGGGDMVVHDFLETVDATTADYVGADNGPSDLIVDSAGLFTPGSTYYIWDIVGFHWESFIVGSIPNATTIRTVPWAGVAKNYVSGSLISTTPPLFDAYRIKAKINNDAANTRMWIILGNVTPASLTTASLVADINALTPECEFHITEGTDSAGAGIGADLALDTDIPDATGPCRFMGIVMSGVEMGGTASGEVVLFRRDAVSNTLVALTLA